ncbi:MAG TPA: hypothetical protein VMU04_11365 [Candidatus Acidoferrum sp.]|nr:hypothetical protein [Candidatus Acidoferrum sp.]
MNRHDPLSDLGGSPPPAPATPVKPSALLGELAAVPDCTLAFLDVSTEPKLHRPAGEIRAEFTAFCAERPQFKSWRRAWSAYKANLKLQRIPVVAPPPVRRQPVPIAQLPTVQTSAPALPLSLQRARARARLFASLP